MTRELEEHAIEEFVRTAQQCVRAFLAEQDTGDPAELAEGRPHANLHVWTNPPTAQIFYVARAGSADTHVWYGTEAPIGPVIEAAAALFHHWERPEPLIHEQFQVLSDDLHLTVQLSTVAKGVGEDAYTES